MSRIELKNIRIDPVDCFHKFHTTVDVLRLDLIHPVVSGNKWFKLKAYLQEAVQQGKENLLSFGGAFSNHIMATAATAKAEGLRSIGIIRGEKPSELSPALKDAIDLGMEVFFVSREVYKTKAIPDEVFKRFDPKKTIVIDEGGYGPRGVEGAKEILKQGDSSGHTHILTAVGTGTTLAGLAASAQKDQKIIGISVFKNNHSLQKEIESLLASEEKQRFVLMHDYHFGGYARHTKQLLDFMNEWSRTTGIPSDFVYTGKLFYAVHDLIHKNFFPPESKLLIIHSGGLQGNRSLPKGTLIF